MEKREEEKTTEHKRTVEIVLACDDENYLARASTGSLFDILFIYFWRVHMHVPKMRICIYVAVDAVEVMICSAYTKQHGYIYNMRLLGPHAMRPIQHSVIVTNLSR